MSKDVQEFRLDGIYPQRQKGYLMQRVKLAAGVISAGQARTVGEVAERFGQGGIHLTTRGSMEIHWLRESDLAEVKRLMAGAGLTSRGACGGAVRGVTCSGGGTPDFHQVEALGRRIQRHFTGNPRFERIPKKFKIGIETDSAGRRHLIQDVGLLLAGGEAGRCSYDFWVAGGLGREPQPAFLLAAAVAEERIIPLIEAIIRLYTATAAPGKRLKHVLAEIGEEEFRRRLESDPGFHEETPPFKGIPEVLVPPAEQGRPSVEARLFAGGLSSRDLRKLADYADTWSDGAMMVTADQNLSFQLAPQADPAQAQAALEKAGFCGASLPEQVNFRVCPGAHECLVGLSATRDIAAAVLDEMGPEASGLTWAISGCHNSCTQPQLADVGIVTARLVTEEDGRRTPRFDIYRPDGPGLNSRTESSLTLDELLAAVRRIGS